MCKCALLSPGDNPIAVNKYIISYPISYKRLEVSTAVFLAYPGISCRMELDCFTRNTEEKLTPCSRVFIVKLTGFQLIKNFSALNGTPRPPFPVLNQASPVHDPIPFLDN